MANIYHKDLTNEELHDPKAGSSPSFVDVTLTGDLAVNGGNITSTTDITLDPAGNDVILDNANLQIQSGYAIKNLGTGNGYIYTVNNDTDTGLYWNGTNDSFHWHYNGVNLLTYDQYAVHSYKTHQLHLGAWIGGNATDPYLLDDSTHGASSSTLYIGNSKLLVESSTPTLTGDWTFSKNIIIDTTPATDHSTSGTIGVFTANENQAIGDACYINGDGEMQLADADAIATSKVIALCADATISADASGNYILLGVIRDDTWTWTVGGFVYLTVTGTTTNTLSQTAPSGADDCIVILGVATHSDRLYFSPQLIIIEHTG